MVHNLPPFPYQVNLSSIQTNWPACSSAIYGHNLEAASLHASLQAISKYFILETGSLKVLLSGGWSSFRGSLAIFLRPCPGCVEAGEAGGAHHFILEVSFFVCFANIF